MAVQTPQGFDRSTLVHAYAQAAKQGLEVTDDAALLEALGVPVLVIPGEPLAFKITTPTDLLLAETLLTPKSKPTEASPSLRAPRSNPDAVER
jgi:2-C-methyl-D-erythritol 4-phosphate cytidylyltransferase